MMARPLITLILRHLVVLLAGGLLGAFYGQVFAGMLVAALGMLAWHLVNLYRLEGWLRTGDLNDSPSGDGLWARTYGQVGVLRERKRRSSKNWRRLVKEFRASTKAFPDAGIILGPNQEILNFNTVARELLDLQKKRDRGQRIENLIRIPRFVDYMRSDDHAEGVEIPSPTNSAVWLSCRLISYGPDQSLLLLRDITRSVEVERMRHDFVANASHELRSPLTVISGYLDGLADEEELPEAWKKPVGEMRGQAYRMGRLVTDLLQLSKLESSDQSPIDKEVNIAAVLCSEKKDALALEIRPHDIQLRLDSDANLLGDLTEIQSVVSNLVSNAIRYTPPEGSITISWAVDDQGGHLSVADTGIGISEEDLPRITERFYRADEGRDRQAGGTGLGLAIVKHALKHHDGELEVTSQLGAGSTFSCHFPPSRVSSN
ncbi:MAG: phosphate regulon sensor histidine kinase PhoR [Gammaproteobacteria bacterium]